MSHQNNVARIRAVYNALGDLAQEVVFVGGATVSLYADRETTEVRETDDVDILVELYTRSQYAAVEERLRAKGFQPDMTSGVICRYVVQGITVDVMPIEESILGFSNRWYAEGYQSAVSYPMAPEYAIRIFSPPYFIASKLEAFRGRGRGDGRTSHDFEDLIFLLNNRSTIWEELDAAPETVCRFLKEEFAKLATNPYLYEWISANLEFSEQARAGFIQHQWEAFVGSAR
ncbi:nucleotidyl transferase AbiEii/AbiGii toxin family protein [Flaviaesturariibacter amylovorans]|uniref:Nucleotidyl transferase AbiEii/AbiGii toxin family protein n=1 Tax=Flaviaesturariibacter amylovorans TaxID=1084520 RepID=A0ABP8HIU5_9BACT